jgi:RNA polymerase sigma-70 factor (ECF subfamily)
MPPVPTWFRGRAAVRRFLEANPNFVQYWRDGFRLLPTAANGCPAFGVYKGAGDGIFLPHGLMALTLSGGAVARVTTFLTPAVFPRFGLAEAA